LQEKIVDPTPADVLREAQMEDEVMDMSPKVEQLIQLLSNIDPRRDSFAENEQLQSLYNETLAIRPKLVKLIEKYSLKKGMENGCYLDSKSSVFMAANDNLLFRYL
jgi:signal transducing adaptor molecule